MDPFTVQQLIEEPTLVPSKALILYSGTTQELKPPPKNYPATGPRLRTPHPIREPVTPPPIVEEEQLVIPGNLRGTQSDGDYGICLPYFGNYCGPYYSAGQLQASVQSSIPPCSDADQVCLEHDACYAVGRDHSECDHDFVMNDHADPFMSALIRMQISARNLYSFWSNISEFDNMTNKRGKSAVKQDKAKNKNSKNQQQQRNMQLVQAPTAMAIRQSNVANKPQYKTSKTGVIITHSELITGLFVGSGAPTAYSAVKLVINPGKFSTFPWLATIATNYDKYVFRKLKFIYMPLVATSVSGRVGLAYDYDSSDAVPGNRADFFSMTKHSEAAIWAPLALDVPLDNVERFTNTHTLTDSKLIDVGSIVYMSDASSATAGSVVGDVLCEYEVELRRPQSPAYVTQSVSFTTGYSTGLDLSQYIKGPTLANITAFGSTSLQFNALSPGRYLVFASVNDTGAGTPTLTLSYVAGAALVGNARTATSTTDSYIAAVFDVSAGAGTVQLVCAINFSACEKTMLTISKVDSSVPGFL